MTSHKRLRRFALGIAAIAFSLLVNRALAQSAELPVEQEQLSEKYARLEKLALRIAEIVEADNPGRAEQLRSTIGKSRDLALADRFKAIVGLLEQERYSAAARNQTQLADNLETLLGLLLADPREARLEAERRLLKESIRKLGRLIRQQRSLRNQTQDLSDPSDASQRQTELADETQRIERSLGVPKQGKPEQGNRPSQDSPAPDQPAETPKQRASERLSKAKQAMQRASQKMSKRNGQGASDAQSEAQKELEQAKRELEEALRQTREEEITRTLTRLATRLRRLLGEQTEIKRLTLQTEDKYGPKISRGKRSAAAGVAKRQEEAAVVAAGALRLLTEDGRSVAFVEVLQQAREDMQSISDRLKQGDTGETTVLIEEDVIQALEEAIAAVDSQLSDREHQKQNQGKPNQSAAQQEPPLVDNLAELRMLRSLQNRILSRTARYHLLAAEGELSGDQLTELLSRLAKRQRNAIEAAQRLAKP